MGCVMEKSNFTAIMDSTVSGKIKNLWENDELTFKKDGDDTEENNEVNNLEKQLFKEKYAGSTPIWHNKCNASEEAIVERGNVEEKAYCYTANDLNHMKSEWKKKGNHKMQAIFNTCMGMYYRQHSLFFGTFTHPAFIGTDCAARTAFIINFLAFFGSIGYLILSDKEAGLQKLG